MTLATLRTSFKVKGQGHRPTNADTQICAYLLKKSWCADGGCRRYVTPSWRFVYFLLSECYVFIAVFTALKQVLAEVPLTL